MDYSVHETAIVDDGARIGAQARVWHWAHVCGAVIGERCSLGQNVFVGDRVVVGDNCRIQNNVSVYDEVVLEDDVFCGPSMVFTNVYNPRSAVPRKNEYRTTLVKRGATLPGPTPQAAYLAQSVTSMPIDAYLSDEHQQRVVDALCATH